MLICLIIAFVAMYKLLTTNSKQSLFWWFLCSVTLKTVYGAKHGNETIHFPFNFGWVCFIMLMIFILTTLPYCLIHLLTFKRIIMTPIVLVLSALVFCILLSCLFYTCPAADGASQNQVVGIYFMNASQTAKHHLTPSLLGTFTLVIIATTFVIAMIPARKKLK